MTDDEQLESRLREALVARDPRAAAPTSLRDRVTHVPTTGHQVASPLAARSMRAAGAILATAAAVVIGILGVGALPDQGRTVPLGSPGIGGAPTVAPDLHAAGFVLALPIWLVVGLAIAFLAMGGLILEPTSFSVPGPIARPPRGFSWIARSVPRRLAIIGLVSVALALGVIGSCFSALALGSSWGPEMTHYMGTMNGLRPNRSVEYFRYEPGTTIAFDQTIRNEAPVPVTILGGDPTLPWLELRIFDYASDKLVFDPNATPSFPFVPFELAPNEERQVLFVWHLAPNSADCQSDSVVPSPEPTPGSTNDFVPQPGGATTSLDQFTLRYSVLGFDRTDKIELDPIVALWSTGTTTCGFDFDWASPRPSPR